MTTAEPAEVLVRTGPELAILRPASAPTSFGSVRGICQSIWAADWLVMARTLKFGKHFEVKRCLLAPRSGWRKFPACGTDCQDPPIVVLPRAAHAPLYLGSSDRSADSQIAGIVAAALQVEQVLSQVIGRDLVAGVPRSRKQAKVRRSGSRETRPANGATNNAEVQAFQRLLIESVMSDWPASRTVHAAG